MNYIEEILHLMGYDYVSVLSFEGISAFSVYYLEFFQCDQIFQRNMTIVDNIRIANR